MQEGIVAGAMSRHVAGGVLRHGDPIVAASLDRYRTAYETGSSIVVRPVESYEGIERVVCTLTDLAAGSCLVTDLHHLVEEIPGTSAGKGSGTCLFAFHTSGSTGSPKCVVYRRETVTAHARTIARSLSLHASCVYVALPPPRFAYGLSIVGSHLESGVPVTFADPEWKLPALAAVMDATEGPTAVYALPQHVPLLMSADVDVERISRVFIAGGRISGSAVEGLARRFPRLRLTNMYGQAEMGPRLSVWEGDPGDFVEGSIGAPIPGASLRLGTTQPAEPTEPTQATEPSQPTGSTESTEQQGGPAPLLASSGYAMWKCLRPPYDRLEDGPGAGYIVTGDLATRRPDGSILHQGRADHVLNVAGTKVDVRVLTRILEQEFRPLAVRVGSRPSRLAGDVIPVVEIVPAPSVPTAKGAVRRALHAEFGSLAGLLDVRLVEQLTVKESGK